MALGEGPSPLTDLSKTRRSWASDPWLDDLNVHNHIFIKFYKIIFSGSHVNTCMIYTCSCGLLSAGKIRYYCLPHLESNANQYYSWVITTTEPNSSKQQQKAALFSLMCLSSWKHASCIPSNFMVSRNKFRTQDSAIPLTSISSHLTSLYFRSWLPNSTKSRPKHAIRPHPGLFCKILLVAGVAKA